MEIDAPLIVAISALLASVLAWISSRGVDKRAAKRDEVSLLRDEVARLQARVDELTTTNEQWREKYDKLYEYVLVLRKVLIDNRLDVPEMPTFDENERSPHDATTHPKKILRK